MLQETVTVLDDGRITLKAPQGFEILTLQQIKDMGGSNDGSEWMIRNQAEHIILDVSWKKIPLLSRWVSPEQIVRNTERLMRGKNRTFRKLCEMKKEIAGREAAGIQYTYEAQGSEMMVEYLLVKLKDQCCTFSCISQTEVFAKNYSVFEEMLSSVEITG